MSIDRIYGQWYMVCDTCHESEDTPVIPGLFFCSLNRGRNVSFKC